MGPTGRPPPPEPPLPAIPDPLGAPAGVVRVEARKEGAAWTRRVPLGNPGAGAMERGAMLGRTLITHEVPEHRTSSLGSLISRPLEVICGSSGKARKNLFYMEQ